MTPEDSVVEESTNEDSEQKGPSNIAIHCALKGSTARFISCFDNEEDPYHEKVAEQVGLRNEDDGKSPLDYASSLGRNEMIKELIFRGAEVDDQNKNGYAALHYAAVWGKIGALKILVDNGANLQLKTKSNERAREIALRYCQTECVDYLDWAEAKQTLLDHIKMIRETVADPEKLQGRFSKDDKNVCTNSCNEKQDWAENSTNATTKDFLDKKADMEEMLGPIWQKLSEPPPAKK